MHSDPEGPLPVVVAAVTQQTFPPVQSLAFVQATHTLLAQSIMSAGVHWFTVGQQTMGAPQGVTVQSQPSPPSHASTPPLELDVELPPLLVEPLVPDVVPVVVPDELPVLAALPSLPPSVWVDELVVELLHAAASEKPVARTETIAIFMKNSPK